MKLSLAARHYQKGWNSRSTFLETSKFHLISANLALAAIMSHESIPKEPVAFELLVSINPHKV